MRQMIARLQYRRDIDGAICMPVAGVHVQKEMDMLTMLSRWLPTYLADLLCEFSARDAGDDVRQDQMSCTKKLRNTVG